MRHIVCEECKKRYDYDRDEFCPKCGAFNQPVKTWGVDAQGNIVRVHGVNEQNHAGSFVHSEVHREKRVRQAQGMDQKKRPVPKPAAPRAAAQRLAPPRQPVRPVQRKNNTASGFPKTLFWIIAAIIFVNLILPLLNILFRI